MYFVMFVGNKWASRRLVSASRGFAVYHSNDLFCICCLSSRICKLQLLGNLSRTVVVGISTKLSWPLSLNIAV